MSAVRVLADTLRELVRFRELLFILTLRDIRARYRGYGLGYLWSIVNPLLLLIIYTIVFSTILKVGVDDFALFLACGLLPWLWFSNGISVAAGSVRHGGGLVRRVYFPTQVLPLVSVSSQLVHFVLSLPLLLGFALLAGRSLGPPVLAVAPLVCVQFVLTAALGLCVASLGVRYRDLDYILGNLLMILFFLAPIIYAPEMVPGGLRAVFLLNPLAILIDGYQDTIYRGVWPDWLRLGFAFAVSALLFLLGTTVFERERWSFAEQI